MGLYTGYGLSGLRIEYHQRGFVDRVPPERVCEARTATDCDECGAWT